MLSSKCALCDRKNLRFIKEQETGGLINSLLEVKSPLEGIRILDSII